MRAVIFSFIPCSESSMVASTRVARYLRDQLELPLIWSADIAEHRDLDALLIVNGAFGYCRCLEELSHAILGARRIVWVQQDYTIVRPINDGQATSPFRRAFVQRREMGKSHLEFWTTCEVESKATSLSRLINWNCLSVRYYTLNRTGGDDVAYYGSFRVGRQKYFEKFFKEPRCKMTISSPSKKFAETYRSKLITHVGQVADLTSWLNERGMGLYLEDRKSHSEYHSPPNRFYEMLSAGLPMVFQPEAGYTLRKAGYDPQDYVVSNTIELARRLDDRGKIGKAQEQWVDRALSERVALDNDVHNAWSALRSAL